MKPANNPVIAITRISDANGVKPAAEETGADAPREIRYPVTDATGNAINIQGSFIWKIRRL